MYNALPLNSQSVQQPKSRAVPPSKDVSSLSATQDKLLVYPRAVLYQALETILL
jgi:hypothetical protein